MYLKIMPSAQAGGQALRTPEKSPPETTGAPEGPQLHNYMEDMVLEKLERTIKVLNGCDCERCLKDVLALALNQLPTAYAVSDSDGDRYLKKLRGAYEVKATAALIKAIQQVKKNPRH